MSDIDPAEHRLRALVSRLAPDIAADIAAPAPFRDPGPDLADMDAAYAVQLEVAARLAPGRGGVAGRKIAWNSAQQLAMAGLAEPGAAHVFADQIAAAQDGPARIEAARFMSLAVEPEIAAILAADMAPRPGGHDRASAAAAVARLVPAFEILDRRRVDPGARPVAVVAANIFNAGAALGGPGAAPDQVDPARLRARVTLNGETLLDAEGTAPMDPLEAVAFLANRFNALGQTLRAGETLLLGAHLPPRQIDAPARLRFEIAQLGAVALEVV
ncbi:fumarylacetoacetate hydrolase family protein [Oceanicella actignis]|uniref:2-keto-4-pentenoate hydratase n=1 Tax=Oceanicella actignis TaxID=1189325 RepID=A0A1M7SBQ7_9RHOB|nr:fumarylacetoacetate hydrolase family protein [Oceanicella actignis]TYO91497.1 2-keto-4-pentenoate hydratase [Oceanicella actignis]SET26704.1 2-keto-4-pentenoate hydratase [Oceanicella actignis]SHN55977.1 2-keto-4-pentenoate hydratase [Oceanicella actignis]